METPAPAETTETVASRRHTRVWWVAIATIVLLYGIPAAIAMSPRACGSCHAMGPYYETWSESRHRATASSCPHCHADPGLVSRAVYPLRIYGDIASTVAGRRLNLTAFAGVSSDACTRSGCHSFNRLASFSGEITINHRLHAEEAEMTCVDCHVGAGHADVGGRSSNPPMELCEPCHAGDMDECGYCHTRRALPRDPDADSER